MVGGLTITVRMQVGANEAVLLDHALHLRHAGDALVHVNAEETV